MFPVSFNGRRRGRALLVPAFSILLAVSLLKTTAAVAQDATGPQQAKPATQSLPPINVSGPRPVQRAAVKPRPGGAATAVRVPRHQPQPSLQPRPSPPTVAAYDIKQRNVLVPVNTTTVDVAGELDSKGVELAAAVKPIDGLKLWGNAAFTHARFVNFDVWTGNTPSNVAPLIWNAGASYRFYYWPWPAEFGGSVRHVGNRFLFPDDATTLLAYTTADVYTFIDIPGRDLLRPEIENLRIGFRVRNLTNAVYAQWADSTYPDQVLLGAPRTYEGWMSARW